MLDTGEDFYEGFNLFNGIEHLRSPLTATPPQMPARPEACGDDAAWALVCDCLSPDEGARPRPTFAVVADTIETLRSGGGGGGPHTSWLGVAADPELAKTV